MQNALCVCVQVISSKILDDLSFLYYFIAALSSQET